MAHENDSSADAPDDAAIPTRRSLARAAAEARGAANVRSGTDRTVTRRRKAARPARRSTAAAVVAADPRPEPRRSVRKPLRSLVIFSMVAGLVATVALPAYGALRPEAAALTLQQVAVGDAQSLVVASDATGATLDRESYAATTAEEIEKKKAAEAAAERARLQAEAAASSSSSSSRIAVDLSMVAPGSGEVRWPLAPGYRVGDGFLSRGGAHMGVDLLVGGGTPIFAAAAGVVRVSQESYGGYGVAVTIDHVINGQRVSTLYGHMTYGSRQVESGQEVAAGQIIGLVGSTGRSTANHLHFETYINDQNVDPMAWLESNAG